MTRFALIAGAVLGVGCGPDVRLAAEHSAYAPGDTVALVLSNDSLGTVFYAETLHLERDDGGDWAEVYPEMIDLFSYPLLGAGKALPRHVDLASDLPNGSYRVRELTGWGDTSADKFPIYCEPFNVIGR